MSEHTSVEKPEGQASAPCTGSLPIRWFDWRLEMGKIPTEKEFDEMIKEARSEAPPPTFTNINDFEAKKSTDLNMWGGHTIIKSND